MSGWRFKAGLRILGTGVLILALAGCAPEQTTPPNPNDENDNGGNNLSLPGTDVPQSPLADPESIETPSLAPQEKTPTATVEATQPAAISVTDGNPTEVSDEDELVEMEKNWRDLITPLDLSPESTLVTKLDKLNLPSVFVVSDPLGSIEKYRGLTTELQMVTYIHDIVVVKKDGVSQIVVVGVDNYGGEYRQVEFIGAIDRGNKGGVSFPIMMGNDFDASFRFADRNLDFPKLNDFDNVLAYYESRIGTQLTIAKPEWASSEPFDPAVFALAFSLSPSKSGLSPSGYPLYDGYYQYIVANCLSAESCNPGGISSEEFPVFPNTVLESD